MTHAEKVVYNRGEREELNDRVYLWPLKIDSLICLAYLFFKLSSFRCGCFDL